MLLISLSIDRRVCNRKPSTNPLRLFPLYPSYLDVFFISLLLEIERVVCYIPVGIQKVMGIVYQPLLLNYLGECPPAPLSVYGPGIFT